ncbi:unnamed protein product [Kuraishia capsulata CBS 1993]|uniref:UBX domain-containing protein n=1 Tax=Kuraishia capsulata CBS 1993 TaxID=1382522 RepID=W6MNA1_9ASCO|nr:uncharacterized protein KUCA_T00003727001 [Kuraishia capsulata CBS 1993]CDK27748.1 unnamed protein product [Kuraishia capsulata CBS 1993]
MDAEQQEKLKQLKEITQYPDEDNDKVLRLLRVTNWNLETAISRYFENDFPSLVDDLADIAPSHQDIPSNVVDFRERMDRNFGLIDHLDLAPKLPKAIQIANNWRFQAGIYSQQQQQVLVPRRHPVFFVLLLVPRLFFFLSITLGGWLHRLLWKLIGISNGPNDFPAKPRYYQYALEEKEGESTGSYTSFKHYLESVLGESSDLKIFEGEFNEAFNTAKTEVKWLLVVLVNSESEESSKFIKKYLNNEAFIRFINERDVLLWCGDVSYAEAHEVGRTYRVPFLPFSCLIANASATGQTMPLMSTIARFQSFKGLDDPRKLTKKLGKVMDNFEPQLVAQRYDKQEAELSRLIRQQQDEAYEQSLLKDKQRTQEKRQKEEFERQELLRLQQRDIYFKLGAIKLLERTDSDWVKGEYTRLQIRNNEGLRVLQNFAKDETLYDVYKFVSTKMYISQAMAEEGFKDEQELINKFEEELSLLDVTVVDGYEHQFEFELISPLPKYNLKPDKSTKVAEVKAIWPNGNILVESLDADDD